LGVPGRRFLFDVFRDFLLDADETVTRPLTFHTGAIRTDNLRRELSPISVAAAFQTFDDAGAATNIFDIACDFSIAICGTINRHLVHGSISPLDLSFADGLIDFRSVASVFWRKLHHRIVDRLQDRATIA
jgi:hypothetical protein